MRGVSETEVYLGFLNALPSVPEMEGDQGSQEGDQVGVTMDEKHYPQCACAPGKDHFKACFLHHRLCCYHTKVTVLGSALN